MQISSLIWRRELHQGLGDTAIKNCTQHRKPSQTKLSQRTHLAGPWKLLVQSFLSVLIMSSHANRREEPREASGAPERGPVVACAPHWGLLQANHPVAGPSG